MSLTTPILTPSPENWATDGLAVTVQSRHAAISAAQFDFGTRRSCCEGRGKLKSVKSGDCSHRTRRSAVSRRLLLCRLGIASRRACPGIAVAQAGDGPLARAQSLLQHRARGGADLRQQCRRRIALVDVE